MDNAKSPAGNALDAANAYNNINEFINGAREAAEQALEASEKAYSMSLGIKDKSDASRYSSQFYNFFPR